MYSLSCWFKPDFLSSVEHSIWNFEEKKSLGFLSLEWKSMGPKVVLDPADFNYIDKNNKKKSVLQRNQNHLGLERHDGD